MTTGKVDASEHTFVVMGGVLRNRLTEAKHSIAFLFLFRSIFVLYNLEFTFSWNEYQEKTRFTIGDRR
jgi:hypothetical protein